MFYQVEVEIEDLLSFIDELKDRDRSRVFHHEWCLPCYKKLDRMQVAQPDSRGPLFLADIVKATRGGLPSVGATSFAVFFFHVLSCR